MTGFLAKIAGETKLRVAQAQKTLPVSTLEQMPFFKRKPHDVRAAFLKDDYNIIAEIKFASPSLGGIHPAAPDPAAIAKGYLDAGACMLSILTEPQYFKGELSYLAAVREKNPSALLLRKDFMVDTYQMVEAKAQGADAILIIVAMTDFELTKDLLQAAKDLDLTALVEVHDENEMHTAAFIGADMIGVNNRNLKTLKIDLEIGRALAAIKPDDALFICESGLSTADDLRDMKNRGYDGFLMGTSFMKQRNPGAALAQLQKDLKCA